MTEEVTTPTQEENAPETAEAPQEVPEEKIGMGARIMAGYLCKKYRTEKQETIRL